MWAADLQVIRILYLVNILALIGLPVQLTLLGAATSVFLFFVFGCLGIIITFHRYHSHHSFKFRYRWMEILFTLFGMLGGEGSALGWVALHRQHHQYPDTSDDPHSPTQSGFWDIMTLNYTYRSRRWRHLRDIIGENYLVFLHNYYFLFLAGYAGLLFAGFGLAGVYYGFCAPSALVLFASGMTNLINHSHTIGWAPHPESAGANVWWMNALNFGDGWHNNHHRNPGSFTTKERWWEWDMAGSLIKLIRA